MSGSSLLGRAKIGEPASFASAMSTKDGWMIDAAVKERGVVLSDRNDHLAAPAKTDQTSARYTLGFQRISDALNMRPDLANNSAIVIC